MIYGHLNREMGNGDLSDLPRVVRATTKDLREHIDEFDSIVVRGNSGLLVGSPVSLRLNKPIVIVRKPRDNSHSEEMKVINQYNLGDRYIFLDDFISSGDTLIATWEEINKWFKNRDKIPEIVGGYLYRDRKWCDQEKIKTWMPKPKPVECKEDKQTRFLDPSEVEYPSLLSPIQYYVPPPNYYTTNYSYEFKLTPVN